MAKFRVKEGFKIAISGKDLKSGDEFEAPENEAKIWRTIEKVEEVVDIDPPRRRYNRRDMRAED